MASAMRSTCSQALNASRRARSCNAFRSARTVRTYAATVWELQKTFGVPGCVDVERGKVGNFPKVVLQHKCGSSAEVYLFGASVSSWKQRKGWRDNEVLYPGPVYDAFNTTVAGVSLSFPDAQNFLRFGRPGKILRWAIARTSVENGEPSVELVLTEDERTLKVWPYKFNASYTVSLRGEQLCLDFELVNKDDKPFEFTAALHGFFDATVWGTQVKGLKGLTYLNKLTPDNPIVLLEDRDAVTFDGTRVDSVYLHAPMHMELDDCGRKVIAIDSSNWNDCVVWHPGEQNLQRGHYVLNSFVCVGKAQTKPVALAPGSSWVGSVTMTMQVSNL